MKIPLKHVWSRCVITSVLAFAAIGFIACQNEDVAPVPIHELSKSKIVFDKDHPSKIIYIHNTGNAQLEWSLVTGGSYLQADIQNGAVAPGDSLPVILSVNFSQLPEEPIHLSNFTFNFPQTFNQELPVWIVNFSERKWRLHDDIADAEYDRKHDVIVAVTGKSGKLMILDPSENAERTLQLDFPAAVVSISPDGLHALVGHKAALSYVNLETLVVEKVTGLPFEVFDVVLSGAAWGYVFPANTQWTNLYCVNFDTGDEKYAWKSLYSNSRGRLHPGGEYIYTVSTQLFPSDFEKYDIRNGQATFLYDSPYHGDYPVGSNLWFADDGQSIFSSGGSIFTVGETSMTDIRYKDNLSFGTGISWSTSIRTLDHSSTAQRIYAILNSGLSSADILPIDKLSRFDLAYNFLGDALLENFLLTNEQGDPALYKGLGYFVFFNSSGTRAYVVQKADDNRSEIWAVLSLDIE